MQRSRVRRVLLLAGLAAVLPAAASAQAGSYDRYLNHSELTSAVRSLASSHGNLASVTSLARTDAGRDVWLLTLGNRQGGDVDSRPALLMEGPLHGIRRYTRLGA